MEDFLGFIIFAAIAAYAMRKQLITFYNKYFGDK